MGKNTENGKILRKSSKIKNAFKPILATFWTVKSREFVINISLKVETYIRAISLIICFTATGLMSGERKVRRESMKASGRRVCFMVKGRIRMLKAVIS